MDDRFRPEDGDRMDVDEVAQRPRSTNGTRTLPPPHVLRLPPLPVEGLASTSDHRPPSARNPDFNPTQTDHPSFRPPSAEHSERRRHLHSEPYEHYSYHRPDPQQYFRERTERYPPERPTSTSDPYSHMWYPHENTQEHHARPTRDLRDLSPRSQPSRPHYQDYRHPPSSYADYRDYPERRDFDERREYYDRGYPIFRDDHHFHERGTRRDQYGPPTADRPRYPGPREDHYSQDASGETFTFVHRRPEHQRVRSFDGPERPSGRLLPSAREILSTGSASSTDPAAYGGRPTSQEVQFTPPRSHSAGERLVRPGAMLMEYSYPPREHHRQYAPEDILQSIRERPPPPPPPPPGTEYYRASTPERIPYERDGIAAPPPTTYQSDRRAEPPQKPHRTGFPNSGLRSTAPATPPQPRVSHPELSYRYPGPSLARIPRPPPRSSYSHSQPTSSQGLKPRSRLQERSHTGPSARSPAPSPIPTAPPRVDITTKARSKIRRIIESSVQREEQPDRINHNAPGPYEPPPTPPGPPTIPPPPQHILEMKLPRLVSLEGLPTGSARRYLRGPPHRAPPPERTKEQDRIYAEWLFETSTEVQRCLTRALTYCPDDLLRAADELLFITHWLVTYMHQLGLSYYSKLRHEMRLAFWWKLNWSWFCLIQCSYDAAKNPIQPEEYEPFPDEEAIRQFSDEEMDLETPPEPIVKREHNSEPMDSEVARYPATVPEPLRPFWDLAKRLNAKPEFPRKLGDDEWFAIGDVLVEFGTELFRFGLLDMDLGLLENEIMHRIIAVIEVWQERDARTLKMANEAFRKLSVEQQRVMVMAIKEDDRKVEALRAEEQK